MVDERHPPNRRSTFLASRRECLVLPLLMAASGIASSQPTRSDAEGSRRRADDDGVRHLNAENTIGDLLRHQAYAGFARLPLPWDDRAYDEQTKLSAIGALLPYHSHIDVASTLGALNRLIDDAGQGRPIFFAIYTEAEKREQPPKAHTE